MGLFDRLFKSERKPPTFHHHPGAATPQSGLAGEGAHRAHREALYRQHFGEPALAFPEQAEIVPRVDLFIYAPTKTRPFFTFITSGMSDLPMSLPLGAPPELRRAEVVFYATEPNPRYGEWLIGVGRFPHDRKTHLTAGSSIVSGTGSGGELLLEGRPFVATMFSPCMLLSDVKLFSAFQIQGDAVQLIQLVPITAAELEHKLAKGFFAAAERLARANALPVFDPTRASCV